MKSLAVRIAIAAVIVIVLTVIWSHSATKDSIVIMWGMLDEAEGAHVFVDGHDVGVLKKFGQNPQTAFKVEQGRHEIKVAVHGFESQPATITLDSPGQSVHLMLDLEERADENGALKSVVVLRP